MIDLDNLRRRVCDIVSPGRPSAQVEALARLPMGRSSLTFSTRVESEVGSQRVVVKVAPPGIPPVANRDVLRQARILGLLGHVPSVSVPEVLGCDEGTGLDDPPMFVMTFVEGESFEPILDDCDRLPPPAEIESRALAASAMLAALHSVDTRAPGIADEPAMPLLDEVERWRVLFDRVGDLRPPNTSRAAEKLKGFLPSTIGESVLHGDYRLGNLLCQNGRVLAIIDWEIWTVGDPRIDLAWFAMTSHPSHYPGAQRVAPGMPSFEVLVDAYESVGGPATEGLDWFVALCCFKKAAAIALIVKNNRRQPEPDPSSEALSETIPLLIDRAISLIS